MQCSRLFYPSAWLPRRAMHCGQKVTRLFDIENTHTTGCMKIAEGAESSLVMPIVGSVWGADMSGPQRRFSGEPTCRAPNADMLGSRQVCSRTPDSRPVGSPTTICWGADRSAPERQTADLSAPQRQFAGEPTGLLPNAR